MLPIVFDVSAFSWVVERADLEGKGQSPSFIFFIVVFSFYLFIFAFSLANKEEERAATTLGFFRELPSLFPHFPANAPIKSSRECHCQHQQKPKQSAIGGSYGWTGNLVLMAELQIKILKFRDILDLSSCKGSTPTPMNELLSCTLRDLQKLYPKLVSCPSMSEMMSTSTYQGLHYFYEALKSVGDSWTEMHNFCDEFNNEKDVIMEDLSLEKLGKIVLERLDYMNTGAKEILDVTVKKEEENVRIIKLSTDSASEDFLKDSDFVRKVPICRSPETPTSVLSDTTSNSLNTGEFPNVSCSTRHPLPLKLGAMEKLKPTDVKRLSFNMFHFGSTRHFRSVNQINNTSEPDNCETSIVPKEFPMNITVALENPMIQMDVLNQVPHDVTDDNCSVSIEPSMLPPNPLLPPMLPSEESALLPQQQPQPRLKRLRSASPPPLTPKQSAVPVPSLPMFSRKQSSPPPLSKQSARPVSSKEFATPPPPPPPPPAVHSKESKFPPSPPQPRVKPLQSASPSPLIAKQSAVPLPSQPMFSQKQSSPPPPSKQSAKLVSSKEFATPPPPPPSPPPSKQSARSVSSKEFATPPSPPPAVHSKESKFPPPPPPTVPAKEYEFSPSPSLMILLKGLAPPPPPPLGANKALSPSKINTKLKRSNRMGSLYRLLKCKMEGSNLSGNSSFGRKVGFSADNKTLGMADALAEMTKRSAYFQKIEEDVEKHATSIVEMKSAINSFQTKDMPELRKFHQYVELHLENLTDETQVLARFGDFPTKKLETIRIAAALLSRLDGIATNLESWKIEVPLVQQLKKVECYFNKIKVEVDTIERNKDKEARQFQSHSIEFDFDILLRIKGAMVNVSSNCIEMVLKESKKAKADADREGGSKHNARLKACSQTLWKAFQLAYKVYNFAGGQDDRAEKLTDELAQEIETFTNNY